MFKRIQALTVLLLAICVVAYTQCPPGAAFWPKGNKLYIYFPTSSDATFPEYNSDVTTSPLAAFNVSDLDAGIGTTAQLRDRIFNIVTEDYCEFNVEVILTTTSPTTSGSQWQIVGVGSDSETIVYMGNTYYVFGVAQDVDIGNSDAQDYARVYAASFDDIYGGAGEALNGANSTLERWATAIGHTSSHEAGHNYGLSHGDADPRPGTSEDAVSNHIMATGDDLSGEIRAGDRRHFSDQSYEILAHNVGLNVASMYNWDFVNPNDADAYELELTILSTNSSLSISWYYNGTKSPWTNPSITNTGSTQTFQGTSYNKYILDFSTAKGWSGGSPGIVPPGIEFHIGTTFNETGTIIVYDADLKNSVGTVMDLHPRYISFDRGTFDLSSGDFTLAMFNTASADDIISIRDLRIELLPRQASIESLLPGAELVDIREIPVLAQRSCQFDQYTNVKEEKIDMRIAKLSDKRFVDITYDSAGCVPGFSPPAMDTDLGELIYCPDGNALSLFPATSVYVSAVVVHENAKYFDPEIGEIVTGPLESQVFYQFTGIVPDFNENGIDDLIDIRIGTSVDENGNGVPDESEPGGEEPGPDKPDIPYWLWVIIAILVIIILFLMGRKRKASTHRE